MKFLFAASTLFAIVAAQDLGSLPACGQLCVKNMLGLAQSLGCSATDAKCLCSNANFAHGLNDCSLEACGPAVQASVVAYGTSYCSAAGVPLGGNGGATTVGGAGSTSTTTETTTTGTATTDTAKGTTTGTDTGSAASSASSALSSAKSSASNALSSASSSISGALASATKSASGSATSSAASGFAMRTAAPLAGAGALGLAAIFLV